MSQNNLITYNTVTLPITFQYPQKWGYTSLDDYTHYEHKCYRMIPAGSDYRIDFSAIRNKYFCRLRLYFIRIDSTNPYRVICYEGGIDSTNILDLKEEIEQSYDLLIDNRKTQIKENFFEPGQSIERYYRFFTSNYLVELKFVVYLDFCKPDRGYVKNGIDYLMDVNKDNLKLLEFSKDLNVFIRSIKVIN